MRMSSHSKGSLIKLRVTWTWIWTEPPDFTLRSFLSYLCKFSKNVLIRPKWSSMTGNRGCSQQLKLNADTCVTETTRQQRRNAVTIRFASPSRHSDHFSICIFLVHHSQPGQQGPVKSRVTEGHQRLWVTDANLVTTPTHVCNNWINSYNIIRSDLPEVWM